MASKNRVRLCDKCSKCIYRWANGCPGLIKFNADKCKTMLS